MAILTDSQKKALDFQRHLSVTANAGAGKTTVLVNRFVDILLHTDTRVNELVAITFTDKAASELKKKIADVVEERMRLAPYAEKRLRLEEIRSQLSFANIGTIHSFCAKLLREFPVEAGVDAGFTVLEEVDQEILEREAIRDMIESVLEEPPEETITLPTNVDQNAREALLFSVRTLGRKKVYTYLSFLLKKREQVERMVRDNGIFSVAVTDAAIVSRWESLIDEYFAQFVNDKQWQQVVERLLGIAAGKDAEVVRDQVKKWHGVMPLLEKIEIYVSILEKILTGDDTIRVSFIGRNRDRTPFAEDEYLLSSHWRAVKKLIPDDPALNDADHHMLLRLTRALLLLYQQVRERYDAKKAENGALDFEDLQLRTRLLLQDSAIRERLALKFKYIMVDEYQDTNRLQYEILRPLVSDYRTGNLFIVGDPKQSIYGFRNADVEVFEETKEHIIQSAVEGKPFRWDDLEIESDAEEKKGRVVLSHSFRLLTDIVLFVNYVFSRLMSRRIGDSNQVEYEHLVRGRLNNAPGGVELLLTKGEENAAKEQSEDGRLDDVVKECEMIARRILALHQSKHTVYESAISGIETPRPFEFKDAAILLRSRTHLAAVEKAMVKNGIPYGISGGIGFYQTQEIFDFLNYFQFLLNPHDDAALVGVLRSPFFGISDAELFEVASFSMEEDYWSKVVAYTKKSSLSVFLLRAKEILADNLLLANRLAIPFLVQRIFHQTGWIGTMSGVERGAQSLANIQKLIRIAREFEGRGFTSLFDFVERLRALAEVERREGQASIDTKKNCVHIMTIHAAKGLEFPVVIVPFCGTILRYDDPPYIDPSIGLGFKVIRENDFHDEAEPQIYQLFKERSRQKRIAEEKRIFYVACTRARDLLVLSGRVKERGHHDSFLSLLLKTLDINPVGVQGTIIEIPHQRLNVLDVVDGRYEASERVQTLSVRIFTSIESIPFTTQTQTGAAAPIPLGELFIEPLQAQTRGDFFSATQIKTYLECPTRYFLKYRLGLPEQTMIPHDFDENEDANDKILGEQEGSLVHLVLQSVEDSALSDNQLYERVENALRTAFLGTAEQKEKLRHNIFTHAVNFIASEFGKHVLAAEESFTEYTITMAFGEDYLTGTIDRLYKERDGRWCIVDYKTDAVKPENLTERAEYYRPQLALYALLIGKLFGQSSVHTSLVFTSHPDRPVHFDFDEPQIQSFEHTVQSVVSKIKASDFTRSETLCSVCTYQLKGKCLIPS